MREQWTDSRILDLKCSAFAICNNCLYKNSIVFTYKLNSDIMERRIFCGLFALCLCILFVFGTDVAR